MSSYHEQLEVLAKSINSDGCTSALPLFVDCCWEHDYAYVTGMTPRGVHITKEDADRRFRDCIQSQSSFSYLNPLSWWRWAAVKWFGRYDKRASLNSPSQLLSFNSLPYNETLKNELLQEAKLSKLRIVKSLQIQSLQNK